MSINAIKQYYNITSNEETRNHAYLSINPSTHAVTCHTVTGSRISDKQKKAHIDALKYIVENGSRADAPTEIKNMYSQLCSSREHLGTITKIFLVSVKGMVSPEQARIVESVKHDLQTWCNQALFKGDFQELKYRELATHEILKVLVNGRNHLDLSHMHLGTLPRVFDRMPFLKTVNIESCYLERPPLELESLAGCDIRGIEEFTLTGLALPKEVATSPNFSVYIDLFLNQFTGKFVALSSGKVIGFNQFSKNKISSMAPEAAIKELNTLKTSYAKLDSLVCSLTGASSEDRNNKSEIDSTFFLIMKKAPNLSFAKEIYSTVEGLKNLKDILGALKSLNTRIDIENLAKERASSPPPSKPKPTYPSYFEEAAPPKPAASSSKDKYDFSGGSLSRDQALDILGFAKGSNPDEKQIRSAYLKESRKHHPDKSADPDADRKFKAINAANEVLK
jgi:DnaJ domain